MISTVFHVLVLLVSIVALIFSIVINARIDRIYKETQKRLRERGIE